jgi:hypothetical protein
MAHWHLERKPKMTLRETIPSSTLIVEGSEYNIDDATLKRIFKAAVRDFELLARSEGPLFPENDKRALIIIKQIQSRHKRFA